MSVSKPSLDGVAELVAVIDRLRSPGGCPWYGKQSHASLVPFAIEEAFELVEAVETGARDDLLEELGDVLLQVVLHARLAQEGNQAPFDLDDVARGTAAKLVSRNPHVFAGARAPDIEAVEVRYAELKRVEKGRDSVLDGVPPGLGALARAAKLASRAQRAGIEAPVLDDGSVGAALLRLTLEAVAAGLDPEAELRATTRRWEDSVRAAERSAPAQPAPDQPAPE